MKRFVLSILFIACAGMLFAKNVDLQQAQAVALNAYFQKVNLYSGEITMNDLEIQNFYTVSENGVPVYYIFNFTSYGFIIISAEDNFTPVLGYSLEKQHNPEYAGDNFTGWMKGRAGAIEFVRDNNMQASNEIKAKWENLINFDENSWIADKDGKDIETLLTATWNQDWPYNYYCPADNAGPGGHVYVGCVATAMSQIMHYYRYPNQGSGSHSYFAYPYGTLSVNFGEATYDWDGMVDNSDTYVNLPMALIGYHAGVAVDMQYSADGSGAYSDDVPYAMKTYFGYSNTISYRERSQYPWSTWHGLIQDELEANRPVYYSGRDAPQNGAGHAFVLDGFHSADEMYHFNFGWSGYDNGFYDITDPSGYEWYYYQAMVINFFPGDAGYPYGCTSDHQLTNLVGSSEDGSGPLENYANNVDCSWLIDPQTENDSVSHITLSFVMLDTESEDVFTVYDGATTSDPVLGTFSGNSTPGEDIVSSGNKMLITFVADGDATTAPGWKFEYRASQPTWCTGLTTLTNPTGILEDGSGSFYYKNGTNCLWKIQPPYASGITLNFTEFVTEENVDIVKVYNASNNQLLVTLSGDLTGNLPDPIEAESGMLFITFQADGVMNNPGWSAEWEIGNVGVKEQNAGFENLAVYPNPAQDLLNIRFKLAESNSYSIQMISVTGNVIYEESARDFSGSYVNTIDLSNFADGVYFLNLSSDKGTVNQKVVIQ
ncbi:MAG: C10 family peptidase [Bacteroidales bacterium]|nr:C10 family peptidase [Bacteroidales bacterium]